MPGLQEFDEAILGELGVTRIELEAMPREKLDKRIESQIRKQRRSAISGGNALCSLASFGDRPEGDAERGERPRSYPPTPSSDPDVRP